MSESQPINNRYDFTVLFDVENGNPNGDPDSGNMPRVDTETGNGLVTDVCLKRKIRNYVEVTKGDKKPYRIYIKNQVILNNLDAEALHNEGIDQETIKNSKKLKDAVKEKRKNDPNLDIRVRDYMCENFYDIRTFGAVMTTFVKGALNYGQVRGPVQLGFARSIDPVVPQEVTITRVARTTEERSENGNTEMGNKYIIPYGLYRVDGFINAKLAETVTKFSEDDLQLLWDAILNMFEFDRSAARGKMAVRKLYIFKHSNDLGDAPSYKLFDSIHVAKKETVKVPRAFSDYSVNFDSASIPNAVEVTEKVDGLE